jgi:predicted acylesterase/phospholipase RssA
MGLFSTSEQELNSLRTKYISAFDAQKEHIQNINNKRQQGLARLSGMEKIFRIGDPCPTFKNLVFAGGGGKGLVYPSVYHVLKQAGFLNDIDAVAGSSAGALTAAAIACGTDPLELACFVQGAQFLGSELFCGQNNCLVPNNFRVLSKVGISDGRGIYLMFRQFYLKSFCSNINLHMASFEDSHRRGEIVDSELTAIKELADGTNDLLTFGKLAIARKVKPDIFKDLTITGASTGEVDHNTSYDSVFNGSLTKMLTTLYFNAREFPNVEIAFAARISMSIPIAFSPIIFTDERYPPKSIDLLMIDGGFTTNIPVEIFIPAAKTERKFVREVKLLRNEFDKTMIVVPEGDGDATAHNMLNSRVNRGVATGPEMILGLRHTVVENDWEKVFNATDRSVLAIPHSPLDTESFLTTKAPDIANAQISAFPSIVNFCENAVNRTVILSDEEAIKIRRDIEEEDKREREKMRIEGRNYQPTRGYVSRF